MRSSEARPGELGKGALAKSLLFDRAARRPGRSPVGPYRASGARRWMAETVVHKGIAAVDDGRVVSGVVGRLGVMSSTFDTLVAHPARVALTAVEQGLGGLGEANLWTLSDAELLELRADLEATRARLDAQLLAATREVDGRGAAVATGAASTAAWLRHRLLLHPGAAKAEVALAKDLAGELTATGQALRTGGVTRDQAAAVATAMRALPGAVDPATRRARRGLDAHRGRPVRRRGDAQAGPAPGPGRRPRARRRPRTRRGPPRGPAGAHPDPRRRRVPAVPRPARPRRRRAARRRPGRRLRTPARPGRHPRPADPRPAPRRRTPRADHPRHRDRRDARARRRTGHPDRHHHPRAPRHRPPTHGDAGDAGRAADATATRAGGDPGGRHRRCPRRPPAGSAATRGWSRPSSTPTSTSWTSAGSAGSSPARCAAP